MFTRFYALCKLAIIMAALYGAISMLIMFDALASHDQWLAFSAAFEAWRGARAAFFLSFLGFIVGVGRLAWLKHRYREVSSFRPFYMI